jgi:hypothetical protein
VKHRKRTRQFSGSSGEKPINLRWRTRFSYNRGRILGFGYAAASINNSRRISISPARNHAAISACA